MIALGNLPFAPDLIPDGIVHLDPVPGSTAEFGYYLTRLCTGCHGADLTGGPPAQRDPSPGPDLTPAGNLGQWSQEEFVRTLRTGQTPEGRTLDPARMPWTALGKMTDTELAAIWAYLTSLGRS
jgi:hypothetical protein